jgi:hypothetical protein
MENGKPTLAPQHKKDLRGSGLSDEQVKACGFYTEREPGKVAEILGWKYPAKKLGPCLVIPYSDAAGKRIKGYARVKPDRPQAERGKVRKYESPKGRPNRLYIPPGCTRGALAEAPAALLITEGEKKAAKADQDGFPCLGLVGVYGWQKASPKGRAKKAARRELIEDLASIGWEGRPVFLAFDSDLADNRNVAWAQWHLSEALAAAGAAVKVVRLPEGPPGPDGRPLKVGLDDLLANPKEGAEGLRVLLAAAAAPERPPDPRPEVLLSTEEHEVVSEVAAALAELDAGLYQRGGLLAQVVRDPRPAHGPLRSLSAGPRITTVPPANLRTRITRHVRLFAYHETKEGPEPRPAHPPPWLVDGVHAAGRWPGVRPLEAVSETPVLRPDGTVLQQPGYDEGTGVLYEPYGEFPAVPEAPTKDDARRAVRRLLEVVCDFPFQAPAHRSAWLAGLLTPLARFAFHGPAPLFLIDANTRGAGKGLLADPVALIATGRDFARAAYTGDDDEMRKAVTSIALAGERLVLLDNVAETLGCPSLDAALTSVEWQDRVLKTNTRPRLPLLATWFATGNNVVLGADTARRACHVRLDTPEERPEERSGFRHPDLLDWVRENRARLLVAGLTLLSAYCRAGRPGQGLKPWGSFEGWSGLVRSAVVWAGEPDPGETRLQLAEESDTEARALRGLIGSWPEADPLNEGRTVAELLDFLDPGHKPEGVDRFPGMRAVLAELFDLRPGQLPGARRLGKRLARFAGRTCGGRCLASRPGHGGVRVWFIRTPRPPDGRFGEFGGFAGDESRGPSACGNGEGSANGIPRGEGSAGKATKPPKPTVGANGREVFDL